jgi:hypothetical protein
MVYILTFRTPLKDLPYSPGLYAPVDLNAISSMRPLRRKFKEGRRFRNLVLGVRNVSIYLRSAPPWRIRLIFQGFTNYRV